MSLIYSALSRLDKVPANQGLDGSASNSHVGSVKTDRRVPFWVYVALAACVLIVLGGWLVTVLLQSNFASNTSARSGFAPTPTGDSMAMQPAPPRTSVVEAQFVATSLPTGFTAIATPAAATMAVPAPVPVAVSPAVQRQALPALVPVSAEVAMLAIASKAAATPVKPKANSDQAAKLVDALKVAKGAQAVRPAQARPPVTAASNAITPTLQESQEPAVIDPEVTRQLTVAVKRAIEAGKNDEAQALLQQLSQRLPAESITLLRLSAWQKMQAGDSAQAIALYRQISNRLPGDESSGINLALLHWRAGQREEARQVLGELSERHPESATVQRYQRELGVPR